ncbi:hypothetical protein J7W19_27820 [Streptomyces mobaraensis NBRC 13819 = DSM 40847]|uniref:Uncharacterized protein n=2 Tax=Streptomyces mobaraensis TaxID=35621 RepID=A0A5N5W9S2_STRMB|nr:hypothetical protein [Streptomyces mobaraensis]EMF02138.1 hypothetical protein H340_02874 [Streptomyces mobaraensis NBRC 13819 = DSM 40847]KAB7846889.1 hypothetical protein FRZ00_11810 [Streptomyces mobaraensis]QTT76679.1 hypothetical protein J7W19_27820 [Streptomyces mobaraensis NBRC 13819 = DSM 40847]
MTWTTRRTALAALVLLLLCVGLISTSVTTDQDTGESTQRITRAVSGHAPAARSDSGIGWD